MDITKVRLDTPGCQDKLFFNSAGSSLPPASVTQTVVSYLKEEEQIGGYKLAALKADEIQQTYVELAKLVACKPHNIALAYNATDAYARAMSSIAFEAGDVILTTDDDYVSNQLAFLSLKKHYGVNISRVRCLASGDLDMNDFEEKIKSLRPKLVAVTHVPTNSGLVQDVVAVGKLCRQYDILYLVDACQSVGQLVLDVTEIGCDFLSATGRKFLRGPRGTGFLYISDKVLQSDMAPLYLDLRGSYWISEDQFKVMDNARRFELWEQPYALVLGMGEAARYANQVGMQEIEDHNQQLRQRLAEHFAAIPGIKRLDRGSHTCNIITFIKEGVEKEALCQHLDQHNVYYSTPSVTNARIDFGKKQVDWAIRISPHYFNTLEEMDRLGEIISSL